jgi:hypothetical protein
MSVRCPPNTANSGAASPNARPGWKSRILSCSPSSTEKVSTIPLRSLWLKYEKPAAISILIAKPYCPFLTDAIKEKIGTLSLSAQEKLEAEADKAERKAEKKAETEKKKKAVSIHHPLRATLRVSDPHFHSHPYITGCQGHDQTRSPNKAKDLDVYS